MDLFKITFDELSKIISKHRHLDHCIYADDVFVLSKSVDLSKTNHLFTSLIEDILNWSKLSGAKLSLDKCKTLHICRKKSCNSDSLSLKINNVNISSVHNLKNLDLIVNNKYNWKPHCIGLKKSLAAKNFRPHC